MLKRNFLKLIGLSCLSFLSLPYKFLYSVTKKIINPELSQSQKNKRLIKETERLFSSILLREIRKGFTHCVIFGVKLFY